MRTTPGDGRLYRSSLIRAREYIRVLVSSYVHESVKYYITLTRIIALLINRAIKSVAVYIVIYYTNIRHGATDVRE